METSQGASGFANIVGGTVIGTNVPYVLARSFAGVSAPNDTTEDILATVTIPANAMGANGFLRIYTVWSATNNVNVKTIRIRLGGIGGTQFMSVAVASQTSYTDLRVIANRNATNSQVGPYAGLGGGFGAVGSPVTTSAVDTTAATTLVITAQKATGTDALTLEGYTVELGFN